MDALKRVCVCEGGECVVARMNDLYVLSSEGRWSVASVCGVS